MCRLVLSLLYQAGRRVVRSTATIWPILYGRSGGARRVTSRNRAGAGRGSADGRYDVVASPRLKIATVGNKRQRTTSKDESATAGG